VHGLFCVIVRYNNAVTNNQENSIMIQTDNKPYNTTALLVIGDEVLRGDTEDQNTSYLARWLFAHGAKLERVTIVPDIEHDIVEEIIRLKSRYDCVFTSGGVGPTHDDITIDSISKAFETQPIVHPLLKEKIEEHYKERVNEDRLRMARVPDGAEIILGSFRWVPIIKMENVFILPGVPWLFRSGVNKTEPYFSTKPPIKEFIYISCGEGDIASLLRKLQSENSQTAIGSYPQFDNTFLVKISFIGKDRKNISLLLNQIESFAKEKGYTTKNQT
jgi:molybdenum cofactor synthesis domain-containing protein